MDTFSLNLFLESAAGDVVSSLVWLVCAALGMLVGLYAATRLDRFPQPVKALVFLVSGTVPTALLLSVIPTAYATPTALVLYQIGETRLVRASFSSRAGRSAGTREGLRTFDADGGGTVGALHTRGGLLAENCPDSFDNGGVRVCLEDDLPVRDALTFESLGSAGPALTRELGSPTWRVRKTTASTWTVEDLRGNTRTVPLEKLLPQAPGPRTGRYLLGGGACFADAEAKGAKLGSLMRAITAPCVLQLNSGPHRVVLHRDTAFGEGSYLLSLVPAADPQPRWTTSLSPWVEPDSRHVRIEPEVGPSSELGFWLLCERASLVKITLSAADGQPTRSVVVF